MPSHPSAVQDEVTSDGSEAAASPRGGASPRGQRRQHQCPSDPGAGGFTDLLPMVTFNTGQTPTPEEQERTASQNGSAMDPKARSALAWRMRLSGSFAKVTPKEFTFDDIVAVTKQTREREAMHHCMILPGSPLLTAWRTVTSLLVLWAVIVTPVELAFNWWDAPALVEVVGKFVDAACILDMVISFNTAKLKHGRLIFGRKEIAKAYFASWFFIDVLTNFPWDMLFQGAGKSRKVVKILKMPKLLRVIRLLRVAQEEAYYFGSIFSVGIILFLAHYCCCIWVFMLIHCEGGEEVAFDEFGAPARCPEVGATYLEGLAMGLATIGGTGGWMELDGDRPTGRRMRADSMLTGVLDNPHSVAGDLVVLCSGICGFVALAILFANVAHTIRQTGEHTMAFSERLSNLKAAALQHHIPPELITRIKTHFHYVWSCGSDASTALLRDSALTVDLRRQLAFCFYGHSLRQVPFLAEIEEEFLKQLCERVEMECFSPMDRIIIAGEMGTELYFLVVGQMRIELPEGRVLKKIYEGSFFGEMGLLFPGTARTVTVVAETFGWVLIIDRASFEEICTEELLDTFRSVAQERFNSNPGAGLRSNTTSTKANESEATGSTALSTSRSPSGRSMDTPAHARKNPAGGAARRAATSAAVERTLPPPRLARSASIDLAFKKAEDGKKAGGDAPEEEKNEEEYPEPPGVQPMEDCAQDEAQPQVSAAETGAAATPDASAAPAAADAVGPTQSAHSGQSATTQAPLQTGGGLPMQQRPSRGVRRWTANMAPPVPVRPTREAPGAVIRAVKFKDLVHAAVPALPDELQASTASVSLAVHALSVEQHKRWDNLDDRLTRLEDKLEGGLARLEALLTSSALSQGPTANADEGPPGSDEGGVLE